MFFLIKTRIFLLSSKQVLLYRWNKRTYLGPPGTQFDFTQWIWYFMCPKVLVICVTDIRLHHMIVAASYDDGLLTCSQFSKTDGNVNWSSKNPKHVSFIELQWVAHKMLFEFLYFYFVLWNDRAIWSLSQEIKFQRSSPYLNRYKNMFINIASNDLFAFLSHIFLSLIRFFTLYGHKKMPRLNDDMVRWNCISILTLFWTENFQLIIKFLNLSILP